MVVVVVSSPASSLAQAASSVQWAAVTTQAGEMRTPVQRWPVLHMGGSRRLETSVDMCRYV